MRTLHLIIPICCLTSAIAFGQAPTYRVETISTYTNATTVSAANEIGQIVGHQIVASQAQPYVATKAGGLVFLPLPAGYVGGIANDINDSGVIVGAASGPGFGEPAIWTPNSSGGYDVTIPEQFASLPSPIGNLQITGGQAVAISNNGTIVGWSQYQGFQGGPTTRFLLTGPPINLGALGFAATVTAINNNDVIVGGGLRMDLNTGQVTDLGVPQPSGTDPNYIFVIAYALNDQNETVVAAQQATSSSNWVTFYHNDANGFTRLHPTIAPGRFVGVYDNNDLGDIAATGGVLFRAEDDLVGSFDDLLEPASAHWNTILGKITNNRRVYTTAQDTLTGVNAIVQLVPIIANPTLATTVTRNGSGLNAILLTRVSDAVLGSSFTTDVDCAGHSPSFAALQIYMGASSGSFLPGGEILLDLASPFLLSVTQAHTGGVIQFSLAVPNDPSLSGMTGTVQAVVLGAPLYELSNALDIVVGS